MTLPLEVDDLTPEWFTSVLGHRVAAATVESIIWGTATKVFVHLDYADGVSSADGVAAVRPGGPPRDVCVKAGFNAELRPMAASGYLAEAEFFSSLAERIDVRLPRVWFAGADPSLDQGVIVLDDLRYSGATFPDMTVPLTPEVVAAALAQQAEWHGATWGGSGLADQPWLTVGSPVQRAIIAMMVGRDHFDHHLSLPRGESMPATLRDPERILAGFQALWASDDRGPLALSHGDAHMGNLFLQGADPGFLDWQGVCLAPWIDDVAYLIGGALSVEDRRTHERDLLAGYLASLATTGAPAPTVDEAWDDYRSHQIHGLVWLLVPEAMQPEATCAAMGARYAAACHDHDVFGALDV